MIVLGNSTLLERYYLIIWLSVFAQGSVAHGNVVDDNDICQLEVGFLKAHFKIYLPRTHKRQEFCEDLPAAAESLFVMEYEHELLSTMLIDFRIIRDVTGLKSFVREEHILAIEDIEAATVFYKSAVVERDVLSIVHQFDEANWYVGIVKAYRGDDTYTAVFPFEVGFTGIGYWPFFAIAIIFLLSLVWYEKRYRHRRLYLDA